MEVALGSFVSKSKLANLIDGSDGDFMMCANVINFENMGAFMNNPRRMQWDKDNGAVYKGFSLNEMEI